MLSAERRLTPLSHLFHTHVLKDKRKGLCQAFAFSLAKLLVFTNSTLPMKRIMKSLKCHRQQLLRYRVEISQTITLINLILVITCEFLLLFLLLFLRAYTYIGACIAQPRSVLVSWQQIAQSMILLYNCATC